jgi:hypothetical protein
VRRLLARLTKLNAISTREASPPPGPGPDPPSSPPPEHDPARSNNKHLTRKQKDHATAEKPPSRGALQQQLIEIEEKAPLRTEPRSGATTITKPVGKSKRTDRNIPTTAEQACRQAIRDRLERDYGARKGVDLVHPIPKKANAQIAQLATSIGNEIAVADQVITNAQARADEENAAGAKPFWTDNWFDPGQLLAQLSKLLGEQPHAGRRRHQPLAVSPETYADTSQDVGVYQEHKP